MQTLYYHCAFRGVFLVPLTKPASTVVVTVPQQTIRGAMMHISTAVPLTRTYLDNAAESPHKYNLPSRQKEA